METEGSIRHSQAPATSPYLHPDKCTVILFTACAVDDLQTLHCTPPLIRSKIVNRGNVNLSVLSRTANQMNPVHASASRAFKFHFNFIFPSTLRPSVWLLSSGLPAKTLYSLFQSSTPSIRPAHLILLHFITTNNIY